MLKGEPPQKVYCDVDLEYFFGELTQRARHILESYLMRSTDKDRFMYIFEKQAGTLLDLVISVTHAPHGLIAWIGGKDDLKEPIKNLAARYGLPLEGKPACDCMLKKYLEYCYRACCECAPPPPESNKRKPEDETVAPTKKKKKQNKSLADKEGDYYDFMIQAFCLLPVLKGEPKIDVDPLPKLADFAGPIDDEFDLYLMYGHLEYQEWKQNHFKAAAWNRPTNLKELTELIRNIVDTRAGALDWELIETGNKATGSTELQNIATHFGLDEAKFKYYDFKAYFEQLYELYCDYKP